MSRRLEDLHPLLAGVWKAAEMVWRIKYPEYPMPFLTYTHRSNQEQNELYAKGRTTKGPRVTNAKAGQSPHNYLPSYAFDVAFKKKDGKLDWGLHLFQKFAAIVAQQPNGEKVLCGGNFKKLKDWPHFELNGWKSMVSAKQNEPTIYELKHPMMRGAKVKEIQQKLGITPRDGIYGPDTMLAVKEFQLANKLLVDGRVGPMTAAKMGIRL